MKVQADARPLRFPAWCQPCVWAHAQNLPLLSGFTGPNATCERCGRLTDTTAFVDLGVTPGPCGRRCDVSVLTRDVVSAALDATGVAYRWGLSMCHWNVLPMSNLKPWTPAQQDALERASRSVGGRVTYSLVKSDGRYFDSVPALPGKGFRVYS